MSSGQGIAAAAVALAAIGGTALETLREVDPPPVKITRLEWDGSRMAYERRARVETLAAWHAAAIVDRDDEVLCEGDGRATYHRGVALHEWTLDVLTDDEGCRERVAGVGPVYVLVTVAPLDGRTPHSRRSAPFTVEAK